MEVAIRNDYSSNGEYRNSENEYPNHLFSLERKLVRKILRKFDMGCCVCGWKEGTCDFHHINGRKCKDAETEFNIALVCPNCHRLIHEKKILVDKLLPIFDIIGKRWKNFIIISHKVDGSVYYILRD